MKTKDEIDNAAAPSDGVGEGGGVSWEPTAEGGAEAARKLDGNQTSAGQVPPVAAARSGPTCRWSDLLTFVWPFFSFCFKTLVRAWGLHLCARQRNLRIFFFRRQIHVVLFLVTAVVEREMFHFRLKLVNL